MKEKDIQRLFGKQNKIDGVFELKLCKGKSIRWDAVKPHQIEALKMARSESGFYYKIPDAKSVFRPTPDGKEQMSFTSRKPFDCFLVRNIPAWVVVCWYVLRKRKTLYYISIKSFLFLRSRATRKSFTEDDAAAMSSHILELK